MGTQAYFQSDPPLPGIGRSACAILGPRSRAGLIAYPVVPPKDIPIATIKAPTINGFNPSVKSFAPMNIKPITRTKVPMISLTKFEKGLRIAGIVAYTPSFVSCSFVSFQRSEEHTSELQSRGHLVCRLL